MGHITVILVTVNITIATIENAPDLLLNVMAEQTLNGWSDAEMARRLGVERSYWTYVRLGKKKLGYGILRGIVQAFPGKYDLQVIDYMRKDQS